MKYIQVVTSWGTYGEEAGRELVKQARQGGVCVAQTITLPEGDLTRESANRVVQVRSVEMGQDECTGRKKPGAGQQEASKADETKQSFCIFKCDLTEVIADEVGHVG